MSILYHSEFDGVNYFEDSQGRQIKITVPLDFIPLHVNFHAQNQFKFINLPFKSYCLCNHRINHNICHG